MRISSKAAALAAALSLVTSIASADPAPHTIFAPWSPSWEAPRDSASVELLRVADRAVGRFAEVQIDSAGRIVGSPPGVEDILINNPAACGAADALLTAPTL